MKAATTILTIPIDDNHISIGFNLDSIWKTFGYFHVNIYFDVI